MGRNIMDVTELVRRAQAGDQEAMGELYRQTSGQVYALALRLTGSPELAMDAVQDTYLSAMQNLDKLREPRAAIHWLAQIAANRCHKLMRKEGRYVLPQQDEEDGGYFDAIPDPDEMLLPENAADSGETRRLLWDLINGLPEAQRESMVLFYFSQFTVEQIAQVQACSEGTVKSRLNYGRKKLKEGVLALEARDGIRLHSLAPVGLLFRLAVEELPDSNALAQAWHAVAAQLGLAAGTAGGGAAAAAAASGNGSAAAGGAAAAKAAAAAKGTAAGAIKLKIAAAVAAGVVAVGGTAAMLHQPGVTFSDPAFEQNIRVLLDQPEGAIHAQDLEQLSFLCVLENGMTAEWGREPYPIAKEGTTAVASLEDISKLPELHSLNYLVPDNGALLDTVGPHDSLEFFTSYTPEGRAEEYLADLSFVENFPALRSLSVHVTSGADLTPVETKTSLTNLGIFTNGDHLPDLSQLTGLYSLSLSVPQEETMRLSTSQPLPNLRILSLSGGQSGPPVLGILDWTPGLEYLKCQWIPDRDLTPLAQLSGLRAVDLGGSGPYDLTPLAACPSLEACSIFPGDGAVIPDGLPVAVGDSSAVMDIWMEIRNGEAAS